MAFRSRQLKKVQMKVQEKWDATLWLGVSDLFTEFIIIVILTILFSALDHLFIKKNFIFFPGSFGLGTRKDKGRTAEEYCKFRRVNHTKDQFQK